MWCDGGKLGCCRSTLVPCSRLLCSAWWRASRWWWAERLEEETVDLVLLLSILARSAVPVQPSDRQRQDHTTPWRAPCLSLGRPHLLVPDLTSLSLMNSLSRSTPRTARSRYVHCLFRTPLRQLTHPAPPDRGVLRDGSQSSRGTPSLALAARPLRSLTTASTTAAELLGAVCQRPVRRLPVPPVRHLLLAHPTISSRPRQADPVLRRRQQHQGLHDSDGRSDRDGQGRPVHLGPTVPGRGARDAQGAFGSLSRPLPWSSHTLELVRRRG